MVCHDKPRAVGARFCQPEHSGARFGKNGGKWQLAVTKQRRWGLFLPNRASKCSIWQKRGQVVVGHTKQGRQSSFLPNRAPGCSIWQKRGQEVVGHDKMKAVGLDLAKAGDRRWSAVNEGGGARFGKKWGSGSPRTLRTPKLSTNVLNFGVGRRQHVGG